MNSGLNGGAHPSPVGLELPHRADPAVVLIDRRRHVALPAVAEEEDVGRLIARGRAENGGAEQTAFRIVRALLAIVVKVDQRIGEIVDVLCGHEILRFSVLEG